jgi:hypothetical protein
MMVASIHPSFNKEGVRGSILARTGRRVRNLEVHLSAEGVILLGETSSYYVKQLAQHGVLDCFPNVPLHNRIAVQTSGLGQGDTQLQVTLAASEGNAEAA